jgi:hypothetical protein
MMAALALLAGAVLLAFARPEIVTISGDVGDVTLKAWTGYALGVTMMVYGLFRSIAPARSVRPSAWRAKRPGSLP